MTNSDWILALTAVAIVLAPIVALWVGGILQRRSGFYKDKLTIFGTLMAQRHDPFSVETVKALNLIDAVFADDRAVREAWTKYYAALSNTNLNDTSGAAIRENKRHELLLEMVRALGLARKISSADLMRGYMPTFAVEAAQLGFMQRKLALEETIRQMNAGTRPMGNGATPVT